jgi:hypothetical protein
MSSIMWAFLRRLRLRLGFRFLVPQGINDASTVPNRTSMHQPRDRLLFPMSPSVATPFDNPDVQVGHLTNGRIRFEPEAFVTGLDYDGWGESAATSHGN